MIFLIAFALVIKRFLTAFFVIFFYKPGRFALRLFFYQVVVRIYGRQFKLLKIWSQSGSRWRVLYSGQIIHVLIVGLTVAIVLFNVTAKSRAEAPGAGLENTIIAGLVQGEFGSIEEEELIEEIFDQEETISPAQQRYLDELEAVRPSSSPFPEEEEETGIAAPVAQGGEAIIKPEITATKVTKRPREETIAYTVKPGDTVSTIAQEFEISVNTILWENNLSAYSIIRPGDILSILPMTGITHKVAKGENLGIIAKKYQVAETEILAVNNLGEGAALAIAQKIIIPNGRKPSYASYSAPTYSGVDALTNLIKPSGVRPVTGNTMNWPTVRQRITQYFSWRHYGLDIADKVGTPIYAADAGVVESIGWGKGYGNQIVINHGGGKKTRYAHLSKFYVKKGQEVDKGETIAAMGSTGWSTGSHLHFEVIISGKKYNPLNYIK